MPALPSRRRVKIWARAIEPDCYEGSILNSLIICLDNGVHFIEPGQASKIFNFRELLFNVELEGNYFSLFQWLYQLEKELGPIVIKHFDIQVNPATKQRKMSLVIASYRYLEP